LISSEYSSKELEDWAAREWKKVISGLSRYNQKIQDQCLPHLREKLQKLESKKIDEDIKKIENYVAIKQQSLLRLMLQLSSDG